MKIFRIDEVGEIQGEYMSSVFIHGEEHAIYKNNFGSYIVESGGEEKILSMRELLEQCFLWFDEQNVCQECGGEGGFSGVKGESTDVGWVCQECNGRGTVYEL